MLRDFGERENSRVRDLVDLIILLEHDLLVPATLALTTQQVWAERDGVQPPVTPPTLPESWPARYERLAADHDLGTQSFPGAVGRVERLWAELFPTEET